jgi:hypothetical protein
MLLRLLFDVRPCHRLRYSLDCIDQAGLCKSPATANTIFRADHVLPSSDTSVRVGMIDAPVRVFLPHLEIFCFSLVGHDDDLALFGAVVQFLRACPHLHRLDLGTCLWELVRGLLPEPTGL